MRQIAVIMVILVMLPAVLAGAVRAQAEAYVLAEAQSGEVLMEKNADVSRPIGSLAKLMTAYVTAQAIADGRLSLDTRLTAGEGVRGMPGASIWLVPGDTATVGELLDGLLIGNANDAALVLAEGVSGDVETFVMDMNAAAFDLGMRRTRFTSPQGFDDPAAVSTARDMARLAAAVLQCDGLEPSLTTWRRVIREDSVPAELVNENVLTRTMDGCLGLKAAHSPAAGACLTAAAARDGMVLTAVILDAPDEDARFTLARQLFREGFAGWQVTAPAFAEEFLRPLPVRGGTAAAVGIRPARMPLLAVPGDARLDCTVVLPQYLTAPVTAGQRVGTVYFYHDGALLGETPLLAADPVPRMTWGEAVHQAVRRVAG